MPSPFPGMNPFMEQNDVWEDFHQRFITEAANRLSPAVGPDYLVRIQSRRTRKFLKLAQSQELETSRESSVTIMNRHGRHMVTVLELLSPTKKTPGPDYDAYVGKRRSILASPVHLVEIDLRRGELRPYPPELPSSDYYVLVSRSDLRPRVGHWPIGLRERLPVIPIPRTAPDEPVPLDLQLLFIAVSDAADYAKTIYAEEPVPPLTPPDREWAESLLAQAPLQGSSPS